jgi:hypothetical protein
MIYIQNEYFCWEKGSGLEEDSHAMILLQETRNSSKF